MKKIEKYVRKADTVTSESAIRGASADKPGFARGKKKSASKGGGADKTAEFKKRAKAPKPDTPQERKKAQIWQLFKKRFFVYSLITAVVFFGLCTYSYLQNRDVAIAYISMNYEDAGKGLAPNGTRFNMYEIKCYDVMQDAIDMAALDGVSPYKLANCTSLSKRGSGDETYISTEYSLRLQMDYLKEYAPHIRSKSMLQLICKAFNNYFFEHYVSRADALLFSYAGIEDQEYGELADYYAMKLDILNRFVTARVSDYGTFRSATTGMTFREIEEKIANAKEVNLKNLNAYIAQTGVAKNKYPYLAKLYYLNYMKNETYQKRYAEYSVRVQNIELYNILQTAIVMVPTYDTKGEFYMSMTKTGIDDIATDAQDWNEQASATMLEINRTDATINSVSSASANAAHTAKTELMLEDIKQQLDSLTRLTLLTDQDFIAYKMDDYLTYTFGDMSSTDKIELKTNFILAFAFYALLWLWGWRQSMKKGRDVA